MRKLFTAILLFSALQVSALPVSATDWKESREVGELFKAANVNGTFVVFDVTDNQLLGHDRGRAETRFIPASTFKIANTLIGLAAGAVSSVDEVLPYGGKPQPFQQWQKDMGLRDAIVMSNVAIYQELARRIGPAQMQNGITRLGYGNQQIGKSIDRFWLDGPLKISAVEQTQFLAALAQQALPFSVQHQQQAREIILIEKNSNWALYGKTGWENAPGQGAGWWVGWVEKDKRIYTFALNLDIHSEADASKRVELGKTSLKALGVL